MSEKDKEIAILKISLSYNTHLLHDYIYKEQMKLDCVNKEILTHEKHSNDVEWQKRHGKLLDEWRDLYKQEKLG